MFFVFHATGIDVYEPASCQIHHKIQGNDIVPGTQSYVCGMNETPCVWGRAIYVGDKFVYVSQPKLDRVLVVSVTQLVVVDIVPTDPFPLNLFWVPQYDQVWVESTVKEKLKTIQVVRDASKRRKHSTVHAEPINSQFDLVKDLFVPVEYQKYAYVTHHNQRGYYKLDLENLRYVHDVDLTIYNCVPENVQFSALCK
jgi:follistatin-related protein 5